MLLSVCDGGPARSFEITRALTSVGSGPRCHLRLAGDGIADVHALIYREAEAYFIAPADPALDLSVNGQAIAVQHKLVPNDRVVVGSAQLVPLPPVPERAASSDPAPRPVVGDGIAGRMLEHLERFSRCVLAEEPWPAPAEALLDSMLSVTAGEHGFLVLFEHSAWQVVAARPQGSVREIEREALSSHVVQQVLSSGHPVVVHDAAGDPTYATAPSVARLKLRSVMCLPLKVGETLLGALYIGSASAAHLFGPTAEMVARIFCGQATLLLENARYVEQLRHRLSDLHQRLAEVAEEDLIASSPVMQRVVEQCGRAAPTDMSVLLQGETGTGKEVLARLIHRASRRAQGPLIAINCATLPPHLLESELFGHARGSFTGADRDRIGLVEAASGGTLFLDEIGEMPLELQPKLLRVLQDHRVRRVGEQKLRPIDLRVVAASNREIKNDAVFRSDLYYRVAQMVIRVPPLRERGDDIHLLTRYLLRRFCAEFQRPLLSLTPAAEAALEQHGWPGNVRELENRLRQAALLTRGRAIGVEDLQLADEPSAQLEPLGAARDRFTARYVQRALARAGNHHPTAAQLLGISLRSLYRYLKLPED